MAIQDGTPAEQGPGSAFLYKAFISYSHRDTPWAKWLLQALETYRLPAQGDRSPVRGVGRIFRDRDEAGAATDLKDEIQRALRASEHMIVIASPHSARSPYVEAEIEAFAAANAGRTTPGRILTLIVDGEPNISRDGTPNPLECFPPAFRGALRRPDGSAVEPLAADARATGDGRTRALAKLVSGLTGIRYDSLVRRDLQRRSRRRWLAVAASIGALVVAGIVSTVIMAGNIEQERLREAQLATQRNFQTVTSVNAANRAAQLLDVGNLDGAVALAKANIQAGDDRSFVPQAFNVLYHSVFQRGAPLQMDIAEYPSASFFNVSLGDDAYLTQSQSRLAVWSMTKGVTYRRQDVDGTVASAADGSAVLFETSSTQWLRFNIKDRSWNTLDFIEVSSQLTIFAAAARSRDTMFGCHGGTIARIGLPHASGGPAHVETTTSLGGIECSELEISPQGTLLVGTKQGSVFELDLQSLAKIRSFDSSNGDYVFFMRVTPDNLIVSGLSQTTIFPRSGGAAVFTFADRIDAGHVSPTGRYIGSDETEGEQHGIVVYDLKQWQKFQLNCTCLFGAFRTETSFFAHGGAEIYLGDLDSKTVVPLLTLTTSVQGLSYLPETDSLLGLRDAGPESVIPLAKRTDPTAFVLADNLQASLTLNAFFTAPQRVLALSMSRASGVLERKYRLLQPGADGTASDVPGSDVGKLGAEYTTPSKLPDGLFAIQNSDSFIDTPADYVILDGSTGKIVRKARIGSVVRPVDNGRYLVLDDDANIVLFDLLQRRDIPVPVDDSLPSGARAWAVSGSSILAAGKGSLNLFSLDQSGEVHRQFKSPRTYEISRLCMTSDEARYFALGFNNGVLRLEAGNAQGGTILKTFDLPNPTAEQGDIIGALLARLTEGTGQQPLTCNTEALTIAGPQHATAGDMQLVWTPATDKLDVVSVPKPSLSVEQVARRDGPIRADALAKATLDTSDARVILRDVANAPIDRFDADAIRISSSAYLPSRGIVAAGLEDGQLRVWDANFPSDPMISVAVHGSPVTFLDFDPSGTTLLSADDHGSIRLWPLPSADELVARAAGAP